MKIGIIRSRETRLVSSATLHIRALLEMTAAACPHSSSSERFNQAGY